MQKVAFICVHNSCRSQIAEALGRHLEAEVFESYSAGTERKAYINQDAVRLMKERYKFATYRVEMHPISLQNRKRARVRNRRKITASGSLSY